MPKDVLVGRVEDLDNRVLRLFIRKNRLRWKDLFAILARLVVKRGAYRQAPGLDTIDDVFKQLLKESATKGNKEHAEMLAEMDFVKRHLGYGLRSVTRGELKQIQDQLMQEELDRLDGKTSGEQ